MAAKLVDEAIELKISMLTQHGLFKEVGPSRIRLKVCGRTLDVIWAGEAALVISGSGEVGGFVAQHTRTCQQRLRYGARRYFICPMSGQPALHLYLVDGRWASRQAHGLSRRSRQEVGRWANNRVENSHLPLQRRERAMPRFRRVKTLQKFASLHNPFALERHLVSRQTYKGRRSAALAEWPVFASQAHLR